MDEPEILRKVGLLLKKAEGTDNPNEAETFYAKAHELMVRYAIDEQRARLLAQKDSNRPIEEPVVEKYMFSSYAHHANAKEVLLSMVARAHSVQSITYSNRKDSNHMHEGNRGLRESQWTRLVGYKNDIETVKLLYLSLLIQSQRFATEDWRSRYGDGKHSHEGLGKFTWISSHMEGFAYRIGERFRELDASIYAEMPDSQSLILNKDANILEWMYEHGILKRPVSYCWKPDPRPAKERGYRGNPMYCIKTYRPPQTAHEGEHVYNYRPSRSYYVTKGRDSSYEGASAGRSAAERADIGVTRVRSGVSQLRG